MKTLRRSLRVAASPGRPPIDSTGMPSAPKISANRSAPAPDTRHGVRRPVAGHGREQRDVDERGPGGAIAAATSRFTSALVVFRSA